MKFTADKTKLSKALGTVARIIERRNTIPVLSNVLIEANGDQLVIIGTDLDLELRINAEIQTEVGGTTTVPAALLNDIIRKMPGDAVAFDFKDGMISVGSGRSKFKLQCLPAQDFPALSDGNYTHHFTMKTGDLNKLIVKTMFAMSSEETRYYLCGVFMHSLDVDGALALRTVATDGHRLALCDIDAPDGCEGMPGIILPRKSVAQLKDMIDLGVNVDVSISANKARFQVGSSVLTTKLIDGTFPDYARVIPKSGNQIAIMDTKTVASASDRVSTVSSSKTQAVKLTFEENLLKFVVNSVENGNAEEEVSVNFEGEPISIGFNNKYLLDILSNITSKTARVTLLDAGSPAIIKDEEGDRSLFVLMPMRI